jgi:hypothetical protein
MKISQSLTVEILKKFLIQKDVRWLISLENFKKTPQSLMIFQFLKRKKLRESIRAIRKINLRSFLILILRSNHQQLTLIRSNSMDHHFCKRFKTSMDLNLMNLIH